MARQYSHNQFFRRVPNALLGQYFIEKRGVFQEIVFDELKETEVEPIVQSFMELPSEQQAEFEAQFQGIDTMACQTGVTTLTDEANYHGTKTSLRLLLK